MSLPSPRVADCDLPSTERLMIYLHKADKSIAEQISMKVGVSVVDHVRSSLVGRDRAHGLRISLMEM